MIPLQPILLTILAAVVVLYFWRLRSRAVDGLIILLCFAGAVLLVMRPNIATEIANQLGVDRGVDLVFYLAMPGLLMMIFLLFARTRELNAKLTAAVREFALRDAHIPRQFDTAGK